MYKNIIVSGNHVYDIFNSDETVEEIRKNLNIKETDLIIKVDPHFPIGTGWIYDGVNFVDPNEILSEGEQDA